MSPRPLKVALALSLTVALAALIYSKAASDQPSGDSFQIDANQTVKKTLPKNSTHTALISLEQGQYVRILLDCWNEGTTLSLYDPAGNKTLDIVCNQTIAVPVSILASGSGTYRIYIGSTDIETPYELKSSDVRFATDKDAGAVEADKAFIEGLRLLSEWNSESSIRAASEFQSVLSYWQFAGDTGEQSVAARIIGEINYTSDDTEQAILYLELALTFAQTKGDSRLEIKALNSLGQARLREGNNEEALEHFTAALTLSRKTDDPRGEIHALNNMGEVHYFKGEMNASLGFYEQAMKLCGKANYRRGQALTLMSLGFSYTGLSEMKKALDYQEQALALWRAMKDARGEAQALLGAGQIHSRSGEKQKALDHYHQAGRIFRLLGDIESEASIASSTGTVYRSLGDTAKALDHFNRALHLYKSIKQVNGEAGATILTGEIYHTIGEARTALVYFQKALSLVEPLDESNLKAYALKGIGTVYASIGNKKQALAYFDKALALYREQDNRLGEAQALYEMGRVYASLGDDQKALDHFERALNLNINIKDSFSEVATLYSIARTHRDARRLPQSRIAIERALDTAETLRARVARSDLRATYLAMVRQSYELYIDVLMLLDSQQPGEGLSHKALQVSERARARALLDMLIEARANIYQGVEAALVERERLLRYQINEKAEQQTEFLASKDKAEDATRVAGELGDLIAEYQQAHAQILQASPRYSALTERQVLTVQEIQEQLLDADTVLLEYALGDDHSYLWAITQDSVTTRLLPPRAEIEKAARQVYSFLTEPNREVEGESAANRQARIDSAHAQYWKAAARLSQMILTPVSDSLKKKRLLVVADGALQYIPLAALPVPQSRESRVESQGSERNNRSRRVQGSRLRAFDSRLEPQYPSPLITQHEIVRLPSASILAVLRREAAERKQPPKSIAVIADPVFSKDDERFKSQTNDPEEMTDKESQARDKRQGNQVSRLPFSRKEAQAIQEAFEGREVMIALDFDASRERVLNEDLSQYRIVHFATHGFVDSEHPELSEILLSLVDEAGQPTNGSLRLHDIYGMKLSAELVVLSACQTALGKDVRGEGFIGLTRGFMYAGASRVVASLWSVNDAATEDLMGRFYRKMLREGLSPAQALGAAQREMLAQRRWENPYFWAGFVLQGEWK